MNQHLGQGWIEEIRVMDKMNANNAEFLATLRSLQVALREVLCIVELIVDGQANSIAGVSRNPSHPELEDSETPKEGLPPNKRPARRRPARGCPPVADVDSLQAELRHWHLDLFDRFIDVDLTDTERRCVILRFKFGHSNKEVAKILGCAQSTASEHITNSEEKQRAHERALREEQKKLHRKYPNDTE